jgi:hypothetical protein
MLVYKHHLSWYVYSVEGPHMTQNLLNFGF